LEELIESKPTARGQILTKFLGLETLKQKEDICKNIQSEWSKTIVSNRYNILDVEGEIETFKQQITDSENEIVKQQGELKTNETNLESLELKKEDALKRRNNDIDQELIRTNPDQLKRDITDLTSAKTVSLNNAKLVEVKEPSQYYDEDAHQKEIDIANNIVIEGRTNMSEISRLENLVKQLTEGSICPTCKRALADVDHTDEINQIKNDIEKLYIVKEENAKKLEAQNVIQSTFVNLKKEFEEYEKNKLKKARYELESEQKQTEIDRTQTKLDNYERNKQKLDENVKIDAQILSLKTQIETANANIRVINTTIERLKNNINNLKDKIKINEDLIAKIKRENETQTIFKIYLTIFGKNGISKVILKNMVPLINQELYRLLVDSCYFILELNVTEKNEVDFIMIDTETRVVKPLNSGSGYERTISSLALRSVLTKISSLPKPNIVVMDEVFGKIADENLEMVGEFFKKIKVYFDHIFVISHNTLIRNWSDNLVMVKKEDNVSSIDFITPKIS